MSRIKVYTLLCNSLFILKCLKQFYIGVISFKPAIDKEWPWNFYAPRLLGITGTRKEQDTLFLISKSLIF